VSKELEWEFFSLTLLMKVKVVMLKYGSPLYFLKSSVRRRKKAHTLALTSPRRVQSVIVTGDRVRQPYISSLLTNAKTPQIELGFCLFLLLHRRHSLSPERLCAQTIRLQILKGLCHDRDRRSSWTALYKQPVHQCQNTSILARVLPLLVATPTS
jgi:hypothetical protein